MGSNTRLNGGYLLLSNSPYQEVVSGISGRQLSPTERCVVVSPARFSLPPLCGQYVPGASVLLSYQAIMVAVVTAQAWSRAHMDRCRGTWALCGGHPPPSPFSC